MKRIIKLLMCFMGAVLLGIGAMILVYMMPTERVKEHILESKTFIMSQNELELAGQQYLDDKVDVSATCIMLHEVIYENTEKNLLTQAMLVSKYYVNAPEVMFLSNAVDLYDQLEGVANVPAYEQTYARYWHGYLVPIKLLLEFFDIEEIFKLNGILLLILIIVCIIQMSKIQERGRTLILAFVSFLCLINPYTISKSFQLADISYITLISMIIIMYMYQRKADQGHLIYLFFFNGIAVAFFDFLTYPLVAWGIPALLCVYLYQDSGDSQVVSTIKNGISWFLAYTGMWGAKICLATLLTDENILQDASTQVGLHTTASGAWEGEKITFANAIIHNVKNATAKPMVIIYLICLIVLLYHLRKSEKSSTMKSNIVLMILISVTPFAWYFVMVHHSYLHSYMTYRELGIFVFGVFLLLGNRKDRTCLENEKRKIY